MGFSLLKDDTINWFRWNLACKCRPSVYSSMPNMALIR